MKVSSEFPFRSDWIGEFRSFSYISLNYGAECKAQLHQSEEMQRNRSRSAPVPPDRIFGTKMKAKFDRVEIEMNQAALEPHRNRTGAALVLQCNQHIELK